MNPEELGKLLGSLIDDKTRLEEELIETQRNVRTLSDHTEALESERDKLRDRVAALEKEWGYLVEETNAQSLALQKELRERAADEKERHAWRDRAMDAEEERDALRAAARRTVTFLNELGYPHISDILETALRNGSDGDE